MKKAKLIATICSFATIAATTTICVVSCSNNSIIRKNLAKTEYNVSIFANEGGIVTVTVNGEEKTAKSFEEKLAFGTNLKVSAFPFAGYKFNKWSDSDTEVASTRNITIDSDKDIIVSFTKVTEEKNLQTPAKHAFNKMIYDEKTYELANDIDPNVFCFKSETISIPQLNGEEDIKINIEESSKLTAVDLKSCDSSVISIDDNFLSDCTGLKSVNLNGLSKILIVGYDFMRNCEELKTLDLTCLRDSVKIESHFLSGCKSLTDLTLPNMDITLEKVKSDGKLPLSIQKNNFMDNAPEDCKVPTNMKGKKYVFPLNEVSYFLPTTPQKHNAPHKVSISAYKNGEIQITANGNTKTIDNTEPFIEDVSGMIRMSATPAQGFKFKKWSDGNTESARHIYATKNWTLFAIFEETEKFNVSVQTTEGGIVDVTADGNITVVDSNNLYNAPSYVGTKILVEAKPDETNNYVFDHWNDDWNDTNPKKEFASLFENVDLTAYFVLKHTLKLEKPEHGWYEIDGKKVTNEFNVTFNDRTPITVKAIAENGYVFSKWSDDVTDSQRTISKDMQLTAYFVEKSTIQNVGQHALTINATDGGIVEVTVNGSTTAIDSKHKFGATLPKETQITIKVNPVDGYKFIGWNNESLVSGNEEEGFALTTKDEDVNLIALFGKKGLETIKPEEKAEQTQNQDCIL